MGVLAAIVGLVVGIALGMHHCAITDQAQVIEPTPVDGATAARAMDAAVAGDASAPTGIIAIADGAGVVDASAMDAAVVDGGGAPDAAPDAGLVVPMEEPFVPLLPFLPVPLRPNDEVSPGLPGAVVAPTPSFTTGQTPSFTTGQTPSFTTGAPPSFTTGQTPSFTTGQTPSFTTGAPPPTLRPTEQR